MTGACGLVALIWWRILYHHSALSAGIAPQQHITVNFE